MKKSQDDLSQFSEVPETFVSLFKDQDISVIEKIISSTLVGQSRFDKMFEEFARLYKEEGLSTIKMPEGVPGPCCVQYSDLMKPHVSMAMDLVKLAVAWVFFHEIKHVQDQHQEEISNTKRSDSKKELHEDELSCDKFATKFLLEKVDQYAQDYAEDPSKVERKRVLSIYIALFAITLMQAEDWEESEQHPAVQDRINNVKKHIGSSGKGVADWIIHDTFDRLKLKWSSTSTPAP